MVVYLSNNFTNNIRKYTVDNMFPNLNNEHKMMLINMVLELLNLFMSTQNYSYEQIDAFKYQLTQNDGIDLKAFLLLLLPFVNCCTKKMKMIISLNDIVTKKVENTNPPQYIFSNFQYGRCNQKTGDEVELTVNIVNDNFELLKDTIKTVSTKLMPNWVDIVPYNYDDVLKEQQKYTDIASHSKWNLNIDNINEFIVISD